ncbi:hypothetical protein EV292_10592 [Sphingomonas sp. BK235]|jgi:hypothetical protein|nr:hypothetical protein EV292_10592 [Sphingomonas sp. BK235]
MTRRDLWLGALGFTATALWLLLPLAGAGVAG